MRYILLIYDCDRPEPGDPRFEGALERVNSFVEECRRRGVLRGGDPLRPASTATSLWRAYKVTDEQVARVVEAAGSQRAAFELIVAAALGASLHRWRCGLKALEEALNKSAQSRLPRPPPDSRELETDRDAGAGSAWRPDPARDLRAAGQTPLLGG